MRCEEARARMLVADPAELAGGGPGPLQEHLAVCGSCRAAARAILAQDAELAGALATLSRGRGPTAVPEEADPTPAPIPGAPREALPPGRTRQVLRGGRVRRALATLAPLAAAAVLAVLFLRSPEPEAPVQEPGIDPTPHTSVNAVTGGGVVVMQTRNPDITVVWNF